MTVESDLLIEAIKNGADGFPLTDAYKSGHRFYTDFIEMMNFFEQRLKKKDYRGVKKKILAGCSQPDEQSYLQCMCELVVLYYAMRQSNDDGDFNYEPKYNGGFNPECSFSYGGKTINIEVKCPHMSKRMDIESHDTLKVSFSERLSNKSDYNGVIKNLKEILSPFLEGSKYSEIEVIPRMDNKLKDYLMHSQKNFHQEIPTLIS